MSGGSAEPEHQTDEKCEHCGLWYRPGSAITLHQNACDAASDSSSGVTSGETPSEPVSSTTDNGENPAMESPPSESRDTGGGSSSGGGCPECGSGDYFSATEVLRTTSGFPEEQRTALRENEKVCGDCKEIY